MTTATAQTYDAAELKNRWDELKNANPHTRARDAAAQLGTTEAQLILCGEDVTRLEAPAGNFGALIEELKSFGRVMALTRNTEAVHERKGEYSRTEHFPSHKMGQVLGEDIDLRLFFNSWAHAFALNQAGQNGRRKRSVQFFNRSGDAIHKTFLLNESNTDAFDAYIAKFKSANQSPQIEVEAHAAASVEAESSDSEIDTKAFREDWLRLTNTHEFFGLTRKYNVTRTQALRLAAPEMAYKIENSAFRALLEQAAKDEMPIMIFVGNAGCIQIHSGVVMNIKPVREWLNVLDADFNLHIREDLISESWIVRKPTNEGIVSSLELYNATGEQIALMFSKRKDYKEESAAWRELLGNLPR